MAVTEYLPALALGYLLGSIPFGLLLAAMLGKGDLRTIGSGNIGATNALRAGGKGLGAAVLFLDALKGAAAVLIARHFLPDGPMEHGAEIFAATGAFVGHLYPVWLKFKGGKGVATFFGILIALLPVAALVAALVWVGLFLITRISSVGGLGSAISAPMTAAFMGAEPYFGMLLGFTLLILWKHRDNIRRLRAGEEKRFSARREETRATGDQRPS
ncbi:glycerol-3-phosphate 1-O-acyltransferase PlsY [Sphingomicrobium lutaoense]|uniref:Glycerol-3-phosphate acyltransferase n=1 Tax=Sphingomicrobium lutaoense TaxID=515949 RepID=A0A839Z033_9SPHN|nr:glycerol-3-phosphate 1-O-acyltransferase PlsY [Sphingomicrobium lutaoense]MBB3763928.1 glycerol-3-phosphate acyltransferase PlsY [Sphingomicrobium lutaoense]